MKILNAVDEDGVGNIRGKSCLRYLKESWFLPPPGGPQTETNVVSTTYLKNNLLLSYNPPKSINCLSNSIQGWAP